MRQVRRCQREAPWLPLAFDGEAGGADVADPAGVLQRDLGELAVAGLACLEAVVDREALPAEALAVGRLNVRVSWWDEELVLLGGHVGSVRAVAFPSKQRAMKSARSSVAGAFGSGVIPVWRW